MPRQWFNCLECGRTRANEYSECAYCGGDVVVMIDEKADMIDIDAMERRMTRRDDEPLLPPTPDEVREMIAEIRRLRDVGREFKARLERLEREHLALGVAMGRVRLANHRKCSRCGGKPKSILVTLFDGRTGSAISCANCRAIGTICLTESAAWAAWDGVE